MKTLYVDAGVKHNGNYGGKQDAYLAVYSLEEGVLRDERIGDRTSNEGEVMAVLAALDSLGGEPGHIFSDSQLTVNWFNRRWQAKKPHIKKLLVPLPANVTLEWIPREENLAGNYLEVTYCV